MSLDAVVVGAGFAGLSAATALAEHGKRVLVLEARPTLGGRASAFTDSVTGERVDNGQHVFFGCYDETFHLLRRVGSEADLEMQPSLAVDVVDREGVQTRLKCPSLPSPFHLLVGVLSWPALSWRDRLAVLTLRGPLADLRRHGDAGRLALPDETVRQWLLRHGQTSRLVELLWEPLAVAALNQSPDVAGARPFVQVLGGLFSGKPGAAALAMSRRPLDALYATPSRAYIERHGGAVRVKSAARVQIGERLRVVTSDGAFTAPVVICAVPWHALPSVFPDRPEAMTSVLDAATRTDASPIITVNLWLDRRVTSGPFVGLPGRTMQWVFDKGALWGGGTSHLSLVSSGTDALANLPNRDLVDVAMADLRSALPAARGARVRRAVVVRERHATFSIAPGQPPRPGSRTGVPGLFLAGDWIETGLPATIEGAVRSGHAAAAAALES